MIQAHAAAPAAASPSDSLDDLLAESMQVVSARTNLKAARAKLTDQRTTSTEAKEIQAKIREWEATSDWKPAAVVAMFMVQVCQCCHSESPRFSGIFQRQSHRTATLSRWVRESTPAHLNLPKEQRFDTEPVSMCHRCVDGQGFQLPELNVPSAFPNTRSF
jgi:hypothetical protein